LYYGDNTRGTRERSTTKMKMGQEHGKEHGKEHLFKHIDALLVTGFGKDSISVYVEIVFIEIKNFIYGVD
jgi:hypothetical protein